MNIYDLIKDTNSVRPGKQVMSMRFDNGDMCTFTYSEMFTCVDGFVKLLDNAGVVGGDRIIIVAENSPYWDIAYLSVMAKHCTAVLIDASLPAEDIVRLVDKSDARCVFTSPKVMDKLARTLSELIPVLNIFDDAKPFAGHRSDISPDCPPTPDGDEELAFIIYSSGTTKSAAGIMHTHDSMIGTTRAAMAFNRLNDTEKMLVCIPNSHIYGVVTCLIGPLMLGASMHFIETMTGDNVINAFKEYQPTIFSCVPRVFDVFKEQIIAKINSKKATEILFKKFFPICLDKRLKTGKNLGLKIFSSINEGFGGHIRIFCAAGAPMAKETIEFYYGVGLNLFLNYGLTETNVPIIANSYDNYTLNSCGKPYSHVQMKLVPVDENGNNEIYIKTPFMMTGYFRDEEATREAFDEDGWLKTGDLGVMDDKGNVSVIGRCKDNIVLSNGKKVTPEDIENKFIGIDGISEFVVCGVPDDEGMFDEIHAFAVLDKFLPIPREEIRNLVNTRSSQLSQYMKLHTLHFVEEIPKTSLQKPKRYLLRLLALDKAADTAEEATIDEDSTVFDRVCAIIRKIRNIDTLITPDSRVFTELGLDSVNAIELDMDIEDSFGISVANLLNPETTVAQLVTALTGAKGTGEKKKADDSKIIIAEKTASDYRVFDMFRKLACSVYSVDVKGAEKLPATGGYVLCPNHQTNFDLLWIAKCFSKEDFAKLGCLAKKEMFNASPASRLVVRVCGCVPIDRDGLNPEAVELCRQKIRDGWRFVIYPEGTRTKDGNIGEFKRGAALLSHAAQVPIIPVKLEGGYEAYPAGQALPSLFNIKKGQRHKISVTFGDPIYPNADIDALNNQVRETVVNM